MTSPRTTAIESPDPERGTARDAQTRPGDRAEPWIADGILAGVLGAGVVAIVFLVVDAVVRAPLWTPAALGSALFLGETLPADASPTPVLVVGYTAVHGAAFVAIGLMGAFGVAVAGERLTGTATPGLLLAALLFVGMEAFFLVFTGVFAPGLMSQFGFGNVATANLLAAGIMAAFVLHRAVGPGGRTG